MENLVSMKIDKSEISHVQSLSDSLQAYQNFKDDTLRVLENQSEMNDRTSSNLSSISNALIGIQGDTDNIYKQLEDKIGRQEYSKDQQTIADFS